MQPMERNTIRFFPECENIHPDFPNLEDNKLLLVTTTKILLGEEQGNVAARYVDTERASRHK